MRRKAVIKGRLPMVSWIRSANRGGNIAEPVMDSVGPEIDSGRRMSERVLLPRVPTAGHDCLILADGFSCREQIDQGAGRRTRHLAEVIAAAL